MLVNYKLFISHWHLQIILWISTSTPVLDPCPIPYYTNICRPQSTNTVHIWARPHHIAERIPNAEFLFNYSVLGYGNEKPAQLEVLAHTSRPSRINLLNFLLTGLKGIKEFKVYIINKQQKVTCAKIWTRVHEFWNPLIKIQQLYTYVEIKCQLGATEVIIADLIAQYVSGTTMTIIRSSRVLYSGCCRITTFDLSHF